MVKRITSGLAHLEHNPRVARSRIYNVVTGSNIPRCTPGGLNQDRPQITAYSGDQIERYELPVSWRRA